MTYSRIAIVLHWLTAVLVLATMPLAWYAKPPASAAPKPVAEAASSAVPKARAAPPKKSPAEQAATNLHKTVGIVILGLTVLRIGWRLTHRPPPLPERMARPLRVLARSSHALFYGLLLAMPLSGWWMSSAVPGPARHAFGFGVFDIPFLPVAQSWAAAAQARFVHTNLAWLMVGLAVLHIAAALKHHFVNRDEVLRRMLPSKT